MCLCVSQLILHMSEEYELSEDVQTGGHHACYAYDQSLVDTFQSLYSPWWRLFVLLSLSVDICARKGTFTSVGVKKFGNCAKILLTFVYINFEYQ